MPKRGPLRLNFCDQCGCDITQDAGAVRTWTNAYCGKHAIERLRIPPAKSGKPDPKRIKIDGISYDGNQRRAAAYKVAIRHSGYTENTRIY